MGQTDGAVDEVGFELVSRRLGALPLVNHFLARAGVPALLARYLPADDARYRLAPATAIGLVVLNLLAGREPLYGLGEWTARYEPATLGLSPNEAEQTNTGLINDDRVGRALERLFDADRASLLTELLLGVITEFGVDTAELHNDSTSITVSGVYRDAIGTTRGGKPTPVITFGHSKDHRPDLKQLVWILTVAADGAVPIAYRLADGNTNDDPTHVPTWDGLVALLGRTDFLYVADSKLCSREAMAHIATGGGRFVTVLPRTRSEDHWFRDWIQTHPPQWTEALRLPPARLEAPDRVWSVLPAPLPSAEGHRVIWVHNTDKAIRDATSRSARIEAGAAAIDALGVRLAGPKCRLKTRVAVTEAATAALDAAGASRWISATVSETVEESFRQERRGRPGANTRYRRRTRTPVHRQLGHHPRPRRLRRRIRRLLPPDQQRHHAHRRRGARRLPLPAQPRTPPPPAQIPARRRPGTAAQPGPDRGAVLLPVPRAAHRRPDRTPDPHRHDHRTGPRHPALPRVPRLHRTLDYPHHGNLRRPHPPPPTPRRPTRPDLPTRTQPATPTGPPATRRPHHQLHRPD
jgi:hypothetical protein